MFAAKNQILLSRVEATFNLPTKGNLMKRLPIENPFRIHGLVGGEYFTDRGDELKRMTKALTEPGAKLLVFGPRRMGKTSAILNAVDTVNKSGGHAFLADLSTASTAVDMGNRILTAATSSLTQKFCYQFWQFYFSYSAIFQSEAKT